MHGVTRLKVTEDVSLIHFSSIPDDMKVIADIFRNILPYMGIEAAEEETASSFRIYG